MHALLFTALLALALCASRAGVTNEKQLLVAVSEQIAESPLSRSTSAQRTFALGERRAVSLDAPMPTGLSPLGQKVFRAYQRYGVFVIDVAGGVTNLRAQANAYDPSTIEALRTDLRRITPLLQRVE